MSASRIKNLILLILLLAVLCLSIAVVPAKVAQARRESDRNEQLSDLFAQYNIAVDAQGLPKSVTLYSLELAQADANAAATALLGPDAVKEESSTRYESRYFSASGTVAITSSGEFHAVLSGRKPVRTAEKDAQKVLRAIGFQPDSLQTVRSEKGKYTVTAKQCLLGVAVFSDGLQLRYEDGALCSIEGTFYPGTENLTRISDETCINCADALVQLLACRNELGWVGSRILTASQGYFPSESASGAMRFVPCWRIETDTGAFLVSGITREVHRIEEG